VRVLPGKAARVVACYSYEKGDFLFLLLRKEEILILVVIGLDNPCSFSRAGCVKLLGA